MRTGCLILLFIASTLPLSRAQAPSAGGSGFDALEKTIPELQTAMAAGTVTSRQLVEAYLARIAAYDKQGPTLNAIVAINPNALSIADTLDAERKAGRVRGPLHGIPVLVKDNYETIEMPTSAGSMALASFHPPADAFQVKKLRDAGAVILAKTNMHELAAGIFTAGSRFGQTRNPYDLDRNPGGSSGGTGAGIAANFAAAGMGSDTCGSIRIPASHNNLVGLRGTHGLSSRSGIVPLSSTQDIGGPLARTITDLAIMLDATVGADAADAVTKDGAAHIPASYRDLLRPDALKGARIGVVRALFGSAAEDREVTAIVNKALDAVKESGAEVIDVVIPGLDELLTSSSLINSEFKFDLADYLAQHANAPVKSLGEVLDKGLYHLALEATFRARNAPEKRETDQYRRALVRRAALRHAVDAVLAEHRLTALVYPTIRRKPARIGDGQAGSTCQLSAHTGLPALGLPAGWTDDGLPIGMDLLGPAWSEATLLALGYSLEQTLKPRRAPFSTPALVNGKAPAPRTFTTSLEENGDRLGVIEFSYDETTGRLSYRAVFAPRRAERVTAIWINRMAAEKVGASIHPLTTAAAGPQGAATLSSADRASLAAGRLRLRVYTQDHPGGLEFPLVIQ
jgi:Asp-tRNA(Asn)/Glu-tRNA(Gln) amidotransferase A subunit family amidase